MNRREFLSSVSALAVVAMVPLSGGPSPVVVTLPSSGGPFTIWNLGDVPLVIEAPTETISLPSREVWRNHPHEFVNMVSDGNSWVESGE